MLFNSVANSHRCLFCQTIARESAVYCRMCGRRLTVLENQSVAAGGSEEHARRHLCSACGFMNFPGELFCSQCGVQFPPIASLPSSPPSKMDE